MGDCWLNIRIASWHVQCRYGRLFRVTLARNYYWTLRRWLREPVAVYSMQVKEGLRRRETWRNKVAELECVLAEMQREWSRERGALRSDQPQERQRETQARDRGERAVDRPCVGGLIYLATPYSHPDPAIREWRFGEVNRVSADLMRKGVHVYSPISHTHPIAQAGGLPSEWEYWEAYDRLVLGMCSRLYVLRLSGWKESVGVNAEIDIAHELGLPVVYVDP